MSSSWSKSIRTQYENVLSPEHLSILLNNPAAFHASCRKIPALFIEWVLGIKCAPVHLRMQAFLDEHPDCFIKAHRGLGKSTQVSVGRLAWEIGTNPNIRIKLVSSTQPEAFKTCRAVMNVIESPKFQSVFPAIEIDSSDWGVKRFSVKRTAKGMRDPTFEPCCIFGRAGGRADLIDFDDICDLENSIRQEGKRQQVKDFVVNNWLPMTNAVKNPRVWRVGTPYHVDDVVADWTKEGEAGLMPMLELKCNGTKESPWPEEFTVERLEYLRQKMGAIAYARAMELVPLSGDETVFKQVDLDAALGRPPSGKQVQTIAAMDLAFTEKTADVKRRDDPDYSVLIIADIDDEGNTWVKRVLRTRTTSPKWRDMVAKELDIYYPKYIVTEKSGVLKGIIQEYRNMWQNKGVHIREVERQGKDKYALAARCQSQVEDGRFHMRAGEDGEVARDQRVLYDEMCEFPVGNHDDCVMCALDLMEEARHAVRGKIDTEPAKGFNVLSYSDIRQRREERAIAAEDWMKRYRDEVDEHGFPTYSGTEN